MNVMELEAFIIKMEIFILEIGVKENKMDKVFLIF